MKELAGAISLSQPRPSINVLPPVGTRAVSTFTTQLASTKPRPLHFGRPTLSSHSCTVRLLPQDTGAMPANTPCILWGLGPGSGPCRNQKCSLLKLHTTPLHASRVCPGWSSSRLWQVSFCKQDQHTTPQLGTKHNPQQSKSTYAGKERKEKKGQDTTAGHK